MRNERRIITNTAALLSSEGLGQLANLLLVVTLARHYGAATLGVYSLSMSVGAVAGLGVSLGIEGLLIRQLSQAQARPKDIFGVLLPVQCLLVPLAWLLAVIFSLSFIHDRGSLSLIISATGYQLLSTLGSLLLIPLQAREQMLQVAACEFAHRLVALLLGALAIVLGASASVFAWAFPLSAAALIGLATWQFMRHFGAPLWQWSPRRAWRLYREAMPFFGSTALSVLYSRASTLLLGTMTGRLELGLYAAADRLMVPLLLGPLVFNSTVYPALARLAPGSTQAARDLCARCIRLLLLATIPSALLGMLFAPLALQLCFGAGYAAAAGALRWLIWTLVLRGVQYLLGSLLAALGLQLAVARARAVGILLFAVLAPIMIHVGGFVGAAIALPICDAVQLGLYIYALHTVQAVPPMRQAVLAPACAAAVALLINGLLPAASPLWRAATLVAVLSAGMYIFGAVRVYDLRFLRSLLRRPAEVTAQD